MPKWTLPRQGEDSSLTQASRVKKTIFIVDDNATVLRLVAGLFPKNEYNVLTASTGTKALQLSRDFRGEIHLLLSDFQMLGMSGIDLATKMTIDRPQLKVLLMSGFPKGMLVLNDGWHFLAKPFVTSQLQSLVVGLLSPEMKSRFSK
jgi:two-component system cell cycle sensor histidine kinase/response regulator CckA